MHFLEFTVDSTSQVKLKGTGIDSRTESTIKIGILQISLQNFMLSQLLQFTMFKPTRRNNVDWEVLQFRIRYVIVLLTCRPEQDRTSNE